MSIQRALETAIERDAKVAQQFNDDGYCVIANALDSDSGGDSRLGSAAAAAYLSDIKTCWSKLRAFVPNMVEFLTASGPLQLTKPNIYECDLHQRQVREQLPEFKKLFDEDLVPLIHFLNATFPHLALIDGSSAGGASPTDAVAKSLTVKLQINKGGCFPWHYDNPSPPNKRKLTLALYLTPDHDAEKDGGEIVLMPFLRDAVVVPPAFNTLVLFRSDLVNHRVMPMSPQKCRYCFTIWFDSAQVNPDDEVNLRAKHLTVDFIPSLMRSPIQRVLSRAVYDEEYRAALVDCFGEGSRECTLSLRMHEAHLKPLLSNPAVKAFVDELIARKPRPTTVVVAKAHQVAS